MQREADQISRYPVSGNFIPVASPLQKQRVADMIGDYLPGLMEIGLRQRSNRAITATEPLFYFIFTGGTEEKILNFQRERAQQAPFEPLVLVAHPDNNSLPAALEILARIHQEGGNGRIIYLNSPDDKAGFSQLREALRELSVRHALQRARIGLIGAPSEWLVASMPDPVMIRDRWGPKVVPIPMEELFQQIQRAREEAVDRYLESLHAQASAIEEPSPEALAEGMRVAHGLEAMVGKYDLDAVTVRCFDLVNRKGTTGCYALAFLNDRGIAAGCEGDLVSTLTMLWASRLSQRPAWMANPARIDVAANRIGLAHCTVAPSMVESYSIRSHFESGIGLALQGAFPPGPVTLVRIGGRRLDRYWLACGRVVPSVHSENACRTQVAIQVDKGDGVADLLASPLGNHLILVAGDHYECCRNWFQG